jgi:hypothetical protein
MELLVGLLPVKSQLELAVSPFKNIGLGTFWGDFVSICYTLEMC